MFEIPDNKLFMDIVHGYISIPRTFVKNIIDTKLFQRLRNIDQTGMRILYPDAKHDRFSHSLGVYHLACRAVDALIANFSRTALYWNVRSDNTRDLFWAKNKILFLLASLLHDVGHAPFSHSLEYKLLENSVVRGVTGKIQDQIVATEGTSDNFDLSVLMNASPHELIGATVIFDYYRPKIISILKDLSNAPFPQNKESFLFAEHFIPPPPIDSSDIDDDLCFIVRMILGLKYKDYAPEMQIRNCFIELLNGGNFDVDKLDYILRDTKMSGISNIGIDVERLLDAVNIVPLTEYKANETKRVEDFPEKSLISELSMSSDCREEFFFTFDGTIKGKISLYKDASVAIFPSSIIASLSPVSDSDRCSDRDNRVNSKIKIDGSVKFSGHSNVYKDGNKILPASDKKLHVAGDNNSNTFSMDNAKVDSDEFRFKVTEGSMELDLNGYCKITIKGSFRGNTLVISKTPSPAKIEFHGINISVLGDRLTEKVPSQTIYNSFSIGFNKKAVNVIPNVLDARDYLYRWIYAHHKVIYYANFLVPAITSSLFSINDRPPPFQMEFKSENLLSLDDAFIWSMVKYYSTHFENGDSTVSSLCQELLSRKYKRSLYKSLAEYDALFDCFSIKERLRIFSLFQDNIDRNLAYVKRGATLSAGFVSQDFLTKILSDTILDGKITDMVWVDASYRLKKNNPASTYIVFRKDDVTTLSNIDLLNSYSQDLNKNTRQYFYLYYTFSGRENDQTVGVPEKLKQILVDYFMKCLQDGKL